MTSLSAFGGPAERVISRGEFPVASTNPYTGLRRYSLLFVDLTLNARRTPLGLLSVCVETPPAAGTFASGGSAVSVAGPGGGGAAAPASAGGAAAASGAGATAASAGGAATASDAAAAPPADAGAAAPPPPGPATLTADPPEANMPAAGGVSTHTLSNPSGVRLAFKVKSTNNNEYRLRPVYGFVEATGNSPLEITRSAGPPKNDKLVIQFKEAAADASDAAPLFKEGALLGELTLPLNAA
uniref:Major sperm protein n=1 Tax=Parascaris univalens TaxID=6257 RepID=A0A915ALA8_PARUN